MNTLDKIEVVISSLTIITAYFILWVQCRQNHKENKQNRTLQINAIKCQHMNDMLTDEKKALASMLVTLDINKVLTIANDLEKYYAKSNSANCTGIMEKNLEEIFKLNREIGNDAYLYDFLLNKQHISDEQKGIINEINNLIREYRYVMQDFIMLYANINPAIKGKSNIEDIKLAVKQHKEQTEGKSELCIILEKYDYKFYEHTPEIISGLYGSLSRKINKNGNNVLEVYINQLIRCEQDKIDALLIEKD